MHAHLPCLGGCSMDLMAMCTSSSGASGVMPFVRFEFVRSAFGSVVEVTIVVVVKFRQ